MDDVWPALGLGDEPAGLLYAVNRAYAERERAARRRGRGRCDPARVRWRVPALGRPALAGRRSVREVATDDAGAIATFVGTTRARSRGRDVVRLEYEAYEGMAEAEMERIANELRERHDADRDRDPPSRRRRRDRRDERRDRGIGATPRRRRSTPAARRSTRSSRRVPLWKKESTTAARNGSARARDCADPWTTPTPE